MKKIPLSKSSKKNSGKYFALVDDEDYEYLMQWNWHIITGTKNIIYVARQMADGKYKQKQIKMHRQLLNVTDPKIEIDHKDHDGLNNQKINLRCGTKNQNIQNRRAYGKSKYLGVYHALTVRLGKRYEYWGVAINIDGKQKYLGVFPYTKEGEILAAKRFDQEAKNNNREFTNFNFPE